MEILKEALPSILRNFFNNIPGSGINTVSEAKKRSIIVDNKYSPVSSDEILGIIKSNPLLVASPQTGNRSELTDCDDYALQLKALTTALYRQRALTDDTLSPPAIGIIITQSHALNLVIMESDDGQNLPSIIDPSEPEPVFIQEPYQCAQALKTLPIVTIYI